MHWCRDVWIAVVFHFAKHRHDHRLNADFWNYLTLCFLRGIVLVDQFNAHRRSVEHRQMEENQTILGNNTRGRFEGTNDQPNLEMNQGTGSK